MLNQELLAAYFADALAPAELAQTEVQIAADQDSRRALADQQLIDQALRVALGGPDADERVKQSVLAVVRATSIEQLRAQVLAETSGRWSVEASERQSVPALERRGVREWSDFRNWAAATLQRWNAATLLRVHAAKLKRVAVVAALMVLGVGSYIYVSARFIARTEIGQFTTVVGSPTVRHVGQRSTLHAQRSTPICLGDHIETGDADRAEIQFRDGTTLRLHFNTILEIPNPKSESSNRQLAIGNQPSPPSRSGASTLQRPPEINLLRGQVWTKVQKATNAPQYAVRTPVATAVARGTEFGLKLVKAPDPKPKTQNSKPETKFLAVLTVKEGTVDFFNAFGTVQATTMTESSASASSAPTEPKRLQTLQTVQVSPESSSSLISAALTASEAGEKLAGGGGFVGLQVQDLMAAASTPGASTASDTNGIRVAQVFPQSPAERAGLQVNDVLLALDGRALTNVQQFIKAVRLRPNAAVTVTVRRQDQIKSVPLVASQRTNAVPGPLLSRESTDQLAALMQRWTATEVSQPTTAQSAAASIESRRDMDARKISRSKVLSGAAQNNLGVVFELEDSFGPAIRAYGRAVYIDPQVALYHFNLGLALRQIGSFDRAAEELETAWRLAPQSTSTRQWFAEIQSLLGHDREALELTEAALLVDPQWHGLWELKARLLQQQNRLDEAREAALKAIELEPHCAVAQSYLGSVLQTQKRLAEAEAAYRKALELAPFDALLHMNLGTVLNDRGQFPAAEQCHRKAIELRPDFVLAYQNLALVLGNRRQYAQAEAALQKAGELDPGNIKVMREMGRLALEQGRIAEAETHYRKAIEMVPHDAESHSKLGQIMAMRGNLPEAEVIFRKAREFGPDISDIHNGLGEVLRMSGKLDEAVQCYRKALELKPESVGALNNLAIIHAMRNEFAEAEKALRALVDRASKDARINPSNFLINLAMVCGKQGKLEDAEKFYRQALALRPNDPAICNSLAWFLADHRINLDEALTLSRRAVQAASDDPNFLDTLGWGPFQRGELDEAEKTLQKALELAGENPPAGEIREHLKKVQEKKGTRAE